MAVSGGAVTGQVVPGSRRGEVLENGWRVRGAARIVRVSVSCEVVLKIERWAQACFVSRFAVAFYCIYDFTLPESARAPSGRARWSQSMATFIPLASMR
jgi:hypothetical protein